MKLQTNCIYAIAGVLALGLTAAKAQTDGALVDALVKKGVLSDQEAEQIRATEAKDYSTTAAAKLDVPDYVKRITFYGDVRYRFEYADEKAISGTVAGTGVSGDNIIDRNRYRVRLGADFLFTDHLKGGVELETNTANDSANATVGDAYGKTPINLGLAYLQWTPYDWVTLTGGKQHNPLYTTNLRWDPDINPDGGSEQFSWTVPFGGGETTTHDPKDMKAVTTSSDPGESLTFGFTALQGIYADNDEFNTKGLDRTDVWQFVEEVPVQFNFDKSTFVKVAPGFDTYFGGGNAGPSNVSAASAAENGGGTQAFTATNAADDLALITAPGEVDWKWGTVPLKFYWDFADNLDAHDRVQNVYLKTSTGGTATAAQTANVQSQNKALGDGVAWLAGFQVGQNKKKGDWSVRADYRQVGLGSIDPNLNDSDWGDSFLNQQGVVFTSQYNFTDFLTGAITVYDTWAYKNGLFAGENATNTQVGSPTNVSGTTANVVGLAAVSQTQRVDVDLQWKF